MPEENTPFPESFGTLPSSEQLDAVFGDSEPTEEPASPGEGAAQPESQTPVPTDDTAQPVGETGDPQVTTEEPAQTGSEEETPGGTEEQITAEPFVFGGRTYATREAAEQSYKEMQGWVTRTRQEMAQASAAQQALAERQQLQEAALSELLNNQSQARAQQDPEYAAQMELMRQLQPLVDQRVAPMEQALQSRLEALEVERMTLKVDNALGQFWERHPDVREGTQENLDMAKAVATLHNSWATKTGEVLDFTDQPTLELAYEVYKDPELLVVLSDSPTLADSDTGLDYARQQAKQLRSSRGQASPGGTPSQGQGVRRVVGQAADVEVPGGRSPAPTQPKDEWEQVLVLEGEDQKNPNPFLGRH